MPMYNLIEYIYNYSDTLESLCQSKRDELTLTNAGYPDKVQKQPPEVFSKIQCS